MKHFLISVTLFSWCMFTALAQNQLSGTVKDRADGALLPYATAALLRADSTAIAGVMTDNYAIEYLQMAGNQSALYYGSPQEAHPRTKNHPYLKDSQYTKARLSYRQIVYPEAMLRLDCNRDELIALLPDFNNIVLFPEKVDYVVLHDQHIIYFHNDSLPGCPSSGYYILLHSGKCKILEKQTATFKSKGGFSSEYDYFRETKFFLYKDGVYYTIRTSRGLLHVLQPYKNELKQFISSHRLRFKENTETFLIRTISEYEKLSGSR